MILALGAQMFVASIVMALLSSLQTKQQRDGDVSLKFSVRDLHTELKL